MPRCYAFNACFRYSRPASRCVTACSTITVVKWTCIYFSLMSPEVCRNYCTSKSYCYAFLRFSGKYTETAVFFSGISLKHNRKIKVRPRSANGTRLDSVHMAPNVMTSYSCDVAEFSKQCSVVERKKCIGLCTVLSDGS